MHMCAEKDDANTLTISCNDNLEDLRFFRGLAVIDDKLIVGEVGAKQYFIEHSDEDAIIDADGRFFAAIKLKDKAVVCVDRFCQDSVFYYSSRGYWAVSNSLLALTERLFYDNVKVRFNERVLAGHFIAGRGLWGGQGLSLNTMIDGIKVVPAGSYIEIKEAGGFSILERPAREAALEKSYCELLRDYVFHIRSIVVTLCEHGYYFNAGLSGGMDSRLNFAMLWPLVKKGFPIKIYTNHNNEEDAKVVFSLQERLGFELKGYTNNVNVTSGRVAYRNWQLGQMGSYFPISLGLAATPSNPLFNVHGASFKGVKHRRLAPYTRGRRLAEEMSDPKLGELVRQEFLSFFEKLGEDMYARDAMDTHYLNTRARYHTGISWYHSLDRARFTPQLFHQYYRLYQLQTENGKYNDRLVYDIFQMTVPELADHEFEVENKGFSELELVPERNIQPEKDVSWKVLEFYGKAPVAPNPDEVSRTQDELKEEFTKLLERDVVFYASKLGAQDNAYFKRLADEALDDIEKNKSLIKRQASSLLVAAGRFHEFVDGNQEITFEETRASNVR
ncbi:hypothetical protein [Salinicola halophyticus]|uniref:hypothetical protein n=1 Tax=Salinicola halophyticus TaxID=1808881 RepID=UPI00130019A7|nr:hypothetical protein [Salinicola halophyticus]